MLLGLALLLSWILSALGLSTDVARWIENIAIAIALIIPLFLSYYEARRRGTAWFVLWIIAVILVIVFYVLNRVGIWWR
jgi:ABC-type xylose transport system permease subunit